MAFSRLRIAVVGAGPAGLTLGALLHKYNIAFTIFDLREKPTDEELEKPSGSLDLHEGTGLAALAECGLLDQFDLLVGECTEAQKVSDKLANIIYEDEGAERNRPEISRHQLINLLLSHVPDSAIQWNYKLNSIQRSTTLGHTEIELDFGENGKQTFDLVIGADGAWSRVRKLLTDIRPFYAGMQYITLNAKQISAKYPHLNKFIGTGSFMSFGDRHGVFSQRSIHGSARIYIFISTQIEEFATKSGFSAKTHGEAKEQLLGDGSMFGGWGANIKELVAAACDDEAVTNPDAELDIRPLYMLPVGQTWEHQSGVTLIGDAAHLMCPWAGEGVNLAMKDSLMLSQVIAKSYEEAEQSPHISISSALDNLVEDFEVDMVERAKVEAEGTAENGMTMFGRDDAAEAMAGFLKSHGSPPQ
jgi:2-polyprenyl-6-methoxyphenol hydroxylase-like FAD-dependent oxidoreductase